MSCSHWSPEAVAHVVPVTALRHTAFSHVEADECGALNHWLAAAPQAAPRCGTVAAMVSINDLADQPPRALAGGETVQLVGHAVRWFDVPHLPHACECGQLMEQVGADPAPHAGLHARMYGIAWRGDGKALLRELATVLDPGAPISA